MTESISKDHLAPGDTPRVAPRVAKYRPAGELAEACSGCTYYQPEYRNCGRVSGSIEPDYTCDLFEPVDLTRFNKEFEVRKVDDAKQLVFGWGSVAVRKTGETIEDHQGDVVEIDELEHAVYKFMVEYQTSGDMHRGEALGTLVESFVVTPEKLEKMGLASDAMPQGWWIGVKFEDAAVFEKVRNGERAMFSIEGVAIREPLKPVS